MHATFDRLRERHRSEEGFTLIELLVVVVIIGILVAIAVPVYLNYRQGAADKSAQSDVRGAISAVEQYYTETGNAYPPSALSQGPGPGSFNLGTSTTQRVTLSDKTTLSYVLGSGATNYRICARNGGGTPNKYYVYDSQAGGSVNSVTNAGFNMSTCA